MILKSKDMNTKSFHCFLNWWIVFTLICVASVSAYLLGMFHKVYQADVTRLSFFIYAIFLGFTVRTGYFVFKFNKTKSVTDKRVDYFVDKQEISWFISDVLLTLGMLGTVLGFIYMLGSSFSEIDPSNMTNMRMALKVMALGMSTALYTTAAGLICSIILKIQLFNFNQSLYFALKDYSNNEKNNL